MAIIKNTTNSCEDVEKMEPSYTVIGTVNRCHCYVNQHGGSSENNNKNIMRTLLYHTWAYIQNTNQHKRATSANPCYHSTIHNSKVMESA
jgi:hypothetical protein